MRAIFCVIIGMALGWGTSSIARPEESDDATSFRIAILPDTQRYAQRYPETFDAQLAWIVENRVEERIRFVVHTGDITQNNVDAEWAVADHSFTRLDGVIPYLIVPGNHEMGRRGKARTRNTKKMNAWFPPSRFPDAVFMDPNRIDNSFQLFAAGGTDWLVLGLEFGPLDSTLEWANAVVGGHPLHRVIVVSHSHVYSDNTLHGASWHHEWSPHRYGIGFDRERPNDGVEVWDKFLRKHLNISSVFNGHVLDGGTGRVIMRGDHGNRVYQVLANYQMRENGGNGWLRLVEFDPLRDRVLVETYSPALNDHLIDDENEFTFESVDLSPSRPLPDHDGDGIPDESDNCPFVPNGALEAAGAPFWGSQAESPQARGVGCACLCGDPNRDCFIHESDGADAQRLGLVPPLPALSPLFDIEFCDLNGDGACNVADSSLMLKTGRTAFPTSPTPGLHMTDCAGYQGRL